MRKYRRTDKNITMDGGDSDSSSDFGDESPFGGLLTGGGGGGESVDGEDELLKSFFAPSSRRARRSDKGWVPRFDEICSGSPVYTFDFCSADDQSKPFVRVATSNGGREVEEEEDARQRKPATIGRVTVAVGDGTSTADGATRHTVYDASMVLAGFLWRQASFRGASSGFATCYLGEGKKTLELGAGTGLVSLLLAHCLAPETTPSRVVATDLETCIKFTEANADRMARMARIGGSDDARRVECRSLHWGRDMIVGEGVGTMASASASAEEDAASTGAAAAAVATTSLTATTATPFDLILCSDLLYTPTLFRPLLETLRAHCRPLQPTSTAAKDDKMQGLTLARDGDGDEGTSQLELPHSSSNPPSLVLFSFERRGADVRWDEFFDLAQTEEFGFRICDVPVESLHRRFREARADEAQGEEEKSDKGEKEVLVEKGRSRKPVVAAAAASTSSSQAQAAESCTSTAPKTKRGTPTLPRVSDLPVSSIVFRAMIRVCKNTEL